MLKAWKSPEAPVIRVMVAEEDECEDDQSGQGGEELAQKQAQELQAVLEQFGDVICETTGRAHDTDHGIDTGEHTPIRSVLYRLALAWKEQLRVEVLSLLEQDIVRPSLSPGQAQWFKSGSQMALYASALTLEKLTASLHPTHMPCP